VRAIIKKMAASVNRPLSHGGQVEECQLRQGGQGERIGHLGNLAKKKKNYKTLT
jgi:hypothetical protein